MSPTRLRRDGAGAGVEEVSGRGKPQYVFAAGDDAGAAGDGVGVEAEGRNDSGGGRSEIAGDAGDCELGICERGSGDSAAGASDIDVVIVGEAREWEVVEYAQDLITSGKKRG